jgi:DNA polymerase-3 subunit epsilon
MLLLGIDLETNSLDTATAEIIEIGYAMFDTEHEAIVRYGGGLVTPRNSDWEFAPGGPGNITVDEIIFNGLPFEEYCRRDLELFLNFADALVGHNILAFDLPILQRFYPKAGREIRPITVIDTMIDLPLRHHNTSKSLVNLCAENGFVNPFPHRAIFDIAATFKLMSMYNFAEVWSSATTPLIWLCAAVSFDDKDKARNRKYRWDSVNRLWVKQIREFKKNQEIEAAEFDVALLPNYTFMERYETG